MISFTNGMGVSQKLIYGPFWLYSGAATVITPTGKHAPSLNTPVPIPPPATTPTIVDSRGGGGRSRASYPEELEEKNHKKKIRFTTNLGSHYKTTDIEYKSTIIIIKNINIQFDEIKPTFEITLDE